MEVPNLLHLTIEQYNDLYDIIQANFSRLTQIHTSKITEVYDVEMETLDDMRDFATEHNNHIIFNGVSGLFTFQEPNITGYQINGMMIYLHKLNLFLINHNENVYINQLATGYIPHINYRCREIVYSPLIVDLDFSFRQV